MTLTRRLRELEAGVLKRPEWGTTKLYLEGSEADLLEQCKRITGSGNRRREVTADERVLLDKLAEIAYLRAVDVFRSVVGDVFCRGDTFAMFVLNMRLRWFMKELIHQIGQQKAEEAILSQTGKSWRQKEKALKALGKTWRTPFSPESFQVLLHSAIALSSKGTSKRSESKLC